MARDNKDLFLILEEAKEKRISKLDIDLSGYDSVPRELFKLDFVEKLILRNAQLILPNEIAMLANLKELDFISCDIVSFPVTMKELNNLKTINYSSTNVKLEEIPSIFFKIDSLQNLDLLGNSITVIPDEIEKLSKLRRLNVGNNNIAKCSPAIGNLKNLRTLWFYNNKLSDLPRELCSLKNLQKLSIERNPISRFLEDIGSLTNLRLLRLGELNLTSLPLDVYCLKNLKTLNLSENKIESLDANIRLLQKLEELDLSSNRITKLPEEISLLTSLRELRLNNNNVSNFPIDIGKLSQLKILNASRNKIGSLPESMARLSLKLASERPSYRLGLDLKDNPLIIPDELITKAPSEIIQYILDMQITPSNELLREAKLIFVGSGDVGKTSIINMMLTGDIGKPEKTDGIEIRDWNITIEKNTFKIHIWDFGGQEIMHATHKFFMTRRSVYVLVIDPRTDDRSGETDVEYWLKLIKSFAPNAPVIIALNKCEVHSFDIGKLELLEKYRNIVGFVETSCIQQLGMAELEKLIKDAVASLDIVNLPVPQSYFNIKNILQEINNDYIEYSDYEKLCKKLDPSFKHESMNVLLTILNDLGIMLNFRDDSSLSLRDTQVLNPQWVTQGVYEIITSREVLKKKGIIDLQDVSTILLSNNYPTIKEHTYIMDLMGKFELCYSVPDSRNVYFIPGAFPKDRPTTAWEKNENDVLIFQYHYDVMVASIMCRFIVRVHQLIQTNSFWRNGVILEKDGCTSLIRSDKSDKTITIKIVGNGSKRDLLSFIRGQFDLIHDNLKGLEIKRYIVYNNENIQALIDYDDLLFYEQSNLKEIPVRSIKQVLNVKKILDGVGRVDIKETNILSVENMTAHENISTKEKILFLASSPNDCDHLRTDKEMREIEEGLIRSKNRHKFEMAKKVAVRTQDLRRTFLDEKPNFVHFSGHGASSGEGGIVLEDNDGNAKVIASKALGNFFKLFSDTVSCVILNSCFSYRQAVEIAEHIEYVIGMNDSIEDDDAIAFATNFYDAIGAGKGVQFAFDLSKAAMDLEGLNSTIPTLITKKVI